MTQVRYKTADVDGFEIFYREAGDRSRPSLLLLHSFPSSSHMFRDLLPLLAERFHLVAPDLPGFGRSEIKPRRDFEYSFDNSRRRSAASPRSSGSTARHSTCSTTARRPASASRWRIPSA